jgi:hypothetical protein
VANKILTKKLVEIEGIAELEQRGNNPETIGTLKREAFMKAALVVRDEIRDLAPVQPRSGSYTEGTLKQGVFAAYGDPMKPNVLVGMNYRIAPHAHLVEFGTSGRRAPTEKKLLKFTIFGQTIFVPSVAPMPKRPYFRPGIVAARASAARIIKEGLVKAIQMETGKL